MKKAITTKVLNLLVFFHCFVYCLKNYLILEDLIKTAYNLFMEFFLHCFFFIINALTNLVFYLQQQKGYFIFIQPFIIYFLEFAELKIILIVDIFVTNYWKIFIFVRTKIAV